LGFHVSDYGGLGDYMGPIGVNELKFLSILWVTILLFQFINCLAITIKPSSDRHSATWAIITEK
tara:strand:- start:271 stop:462 length:192 start_codon:yes stop_codon:yes gene_type:complete